MRSLIVGRSRSISLIINLPYRITHKHTTPHGLLLHFERIVLRPYAIVLHLVCVADDRLLEPVLVHPGRYVEDGFGLHFSLEGEGVLVVVAWTRNL